MRLQGAERKNAARAAPRCPPPDFAHATQPDKRTARATGLASPHQRPARPRRTLLAPPVPLSLSVAACRLRSPSVLRALP